MIYYSDKQDTLTRGTAYTLDGKYRVYLGFMHADGGRSVQYRFKGEGPNSYVIKTAHELDRSTVEQIEEA